MVTLPDSLDAPVHSGDVLGTAAIKNDGAVIAQCNLVAAETVEKMDIRQAFKRLLRSWIIWVQP